MVVLALTRQHITNNSIATSKYQRGTMRQNIQIKPDYFDFNYQTLSSDDHVVCDWKVLREQLLSQWKQLTPSEIDDIGPSRSRLANLVEQKYGIDSISVEAYLRNFERTLPL